MKALIIKLLVPIILILTAIFILLGLTVFVAGTLIFLATQAFYDIYFYSEIWLAYLAVIVIMISIPFLTYIIIRGAIKDYTKKQAIAAKSWLSNFTLTNKVFISLILYQIFKLIYFKKIKEKTYEK